MSIRKKSYMQRKREGREGILGRKQGLRTDVFERLRAGQNLDGGR